MRARQALKLRTAANMRTLSSIKKDLEFNKDLFSLLEVLKTIAVSQYRTLEQKMKVFEKFRLTIESFFGFIDTQKTDHPFLRPKDKRQVVVAITSDSGFLGGLNRQIISTAINELAETSGKLIIIGERGKIYARETNIPFVAFSGIRDEDRHAQAMQLRDYVMTTLKQNAIGGLKVIYPRPVSFTVQHVETITFLPYKPTAEGVAHTGAAKDIIIESGIDDILEYVVYLWVGQRLYELFGLSRLAEFAARFVHLEESTQKLKEMDAKQRLQYFRVRHELIDRNMRELFSARLLFTSKH